MTRNEVFEERREQILDGALKVFSQKGFHAATNRDIADAAGINSPGLIYHYFADKEALFRTVLAERAPIIELAASDSALWAEPVPVVLRKFAHALLASAAAPDTVALLRLVFGEALRQKDVNAYLYQHGTGRILGFLYRYFAYLMDQGILRRADLGAAVRTFAGPIMASVFLDHIFAMPDEHAPGIDEMVDTAVSTFLTGMAYQD